MGTRKRSVFVAGAAMAAIAIAAFIWSRGHNAVAVIKATVLAFIPLTHSVFWGSMAYTLIGGTAVGTVLILLFLPALYAAWFRIKPTQDGACNKTPHHLQPIDNKSPAPDAT